MIYLSIYLICLLCSFIDFYNWVHINSMHYKFLGNILYFVWSLYTSFYSSCLNFLGVTLYPGTKCISLFFWIWRRISAQKRSTDSHLLSLLTKGCHPKNIFQYCYVSKVTFFRCFLNFLHVLRSEVLIDQNFAFTNS